MASSCMHVGVPAYNAPRGCYLPATPLTRCVAQHQLRENNCATSHIIFPFAHLNEQELQTDMTNVTYSE